MSTELVRVRMPVLTMVVVIGCWGLAAAWQGGSHLGQQALGELVKDDNGGLNKGLYDTVECATKREELCTAAQELVLAQEHTLQLGGQDVCCSSAAHY
jgi:hypothetical protein